MLPEFSIFVLEQKRSSPGSREQEKAWPENKVFLVQNYCSDINKSTPPRDKK